jgi:alanine racemase
MRLSVNFITCQNPNQENLLRTYSIISFMLDNIKSALTRNYLPLNIIEISKTNLTHNYNFLSSINKQILVAPVLKSNAYGHGISIIAKELEKLKPPFFCVDSLFEAYELLKTGIKTPILIMGYVDPKSLKTKKLPFSFAVYEYGVLLALNRYQPHAKIHIFVDTGMHREGVRIEELPKFLHTIISQTDLEIEGIMSHFAEGENPKNTSTKDQLRTFQKAISILKQSGVSPKWVHIANSAAILNGKFYKQKLGNMARTGIALYGIDNEGKDKNLKPLLALKTRISQIKNLHKTEKAGYNFTFTAKENMQIAILPIGYYDGVDRELSNKGFVLVNGKECPIIGRVSMNITTIDVTNLNAKVNQEVTVYSDIASNKNSIKNTAKICGRLPYEILIHLASSTKRIITT